MLESALGAGCFLNLLEKACAGEKNPLCLPKIKKMYDDGDGQGCQRPEKSRI